MIPGWGTKIPHALQRDQIIKTWDFPSGSEGKESTCNVGDLGSVPGLERSPGEGNDNPSPLFLYFVSPVFLPGEFHGQRSLAGYSP